VSSETRLGYIGTGWTAVG